MSLEINTERYLEAFKSQFKCKESDITFYSKYEKGIVLNYNDKVYHVVSNLEIVEYCSEVLTSELAFFIPMDIWLYIAEVVHLLPEFHEVITKELNSAELESYLIARNISKVSENEIFVFWVALYEMDIEETYSKAIKAATKVYDLWTLSCELCEMMIEPETIKEYGAAEFYEVDISKSEEEDDAFYYVYRKLNETDFHLYLP